MRYALLASGSKGNSCLIWSDTCSVLIDCGMSKRYLSLALQNYDLSFETLDGLVITHSHQDHTAQIKHFSNIPIYAPYQDEAGNYQHVSAYESFTIKDLTFYPIPLSHDVDVIVGYIVFCENQKLVYITDTGYIKQSDLTHCIDANVIIMESNYQSELLMKSPRPYLTKMRIMSDSGHLSNDQCGQYCAQIVTDNTKEIVLAHLSSQANDPQVALKVVSDYILPNYPHVVIKCGLQNEIVSGDCDD